MEEYELSGYNFIKSLQEKEQCPVVDFSHYKKFNEKLGEGSIGTVYKYQNIKTADVVAVKEIHFFGLDENTITRYILEAKTISKLEHENIIKGFGLHFDEEKIYIFMEYIEGVSLAEVIDSGISGLYDNLSYIIQIGRGLEAIHNYEEQIAHRDLKPGNIMILKDGSLKIIDFGITKYLERAPLTLNNVIMGSPTYMSPEQVNNQIDKSSDLYTFGLIAYELLTGSNPGRASSVHTTLSRKLKGESFPPAKKIAPYVPEQVSDVIEKMLQKNISLRYQSIEEVLSDLYKAYEEINLKNTKNKYLENFIDNAQDRIKRFSVINTISRVIRKTKGILGEDKVEISLTNTGLIVCQKRGYAVWKYNILGYQANKYFMDDHDVVLDVRKEAFVAIARKYDEEKTIILYVNSNGKLITVVPTEVGEQSVPYYTNSSISNVLPVAEMDNAFVAYGSKDQSPYIEFVWIVKGRTFFKSLIGEEQISGEVQNIVSPRVFNNQIKMNYTLDNNTTKSLSIKF